jgi:hypothetical protein
VINALATGIESAERRVSNGIAWIVTGITGMPEFPARVLGAVITSATMPPIHGLAEGLRVFGAVRSGLTGTLGQCACMQALASKYVFEQPISDITTDIVNQLGPVVSIAEPEPAYAPQPRLRGPSEL